MFLVCLVVIGFAILLYLKGVKTIKVRIGQPPFKDLTIVYKYAYFGRTLSRGTFLKLQSAFPKNKCVKLCYSAKKASSFIEYAYGVVLEDLLSQETVSIMQSLKRNGFTLFSLPYVCHSVFVHNTIHPWFPLLKYFKIAYSYKKMFDFIEKYQLCAYPVLEIYDKSTVSIVVPLFHQDSFVVPEAERIVFGSRTSAMLQSTVTGQPSVIKDKNLKLAVLERKG